MGREVQRVKSRNKSQKVSGNELSHPMQTAGFPVSQIKWEMIKKNSYIP
jgi:hypothetical protein